METKGAILVTGANSGIGLTITKYLTKKGIQVVAGSRSDSGLTLLQSIENTHPIKLDVTDENSIKRAIEFIHNKQLTISGLVNNAGLSEFGPMLEMSVDDIQRIMDVNLYGPQRMSSALLPLLIESKGRIVNIGSASGIMTEMFGGAYSISKHSLEAFTDVLSLELTKFGIKVSIVEPGNFKSNMLENNSEWIKSRLQGVVNSRYDQETKAILSNIEGMKQMQMSMPDPEPVAEAVYHALSAEQPNKRYLVASEKQRELTLKALVKELKELYYDYSTTRDPADLALLLL